MNQKISKTNINKHLGSCQCGAIRFSFTEPLDDVWFCHCFQCRKNYGMYGAFIGVLREHFKINKSKYIRSYKSSKNVVRSFCGKCGSPIIWDRKSYPRVYILAGLLDGKIRITNANHIFTKDKGEYYQICDSWPQYKTTPK